MSSLRTARRSVLLVGLLLVPPAPAADPVLDIVVTSSLSTTKEHATSYRGSLHQDVQAVFKSLEPPGELDDGKAPPDGAARYRLFIEHKGTVSVGDALKTFGEHPIKSELVGNKIVVGPDRTKYVTTWCLPYTHTGTAAFRLAEWKAGKYQPVLSWSATVPDPNDGLGRKGLLDVATLNQDAAKAPLNFKPAFPKKLEEARTEALNSLLPGELREAVCQALVPGRIGKVKPAGDDVAAELTFQNKSPWPVAKVKVSVLAMGNRLIGNEESELEFSPPLAPGKSGTATLTGMVTPTDPKLTKLKAGVTVQGVTFDPGK